MKFIEVNTVEGKRVLLNVGHITDIIEETNHCDIFLTNPEAHYSIKESCEEIKKKLRYVFAGIG